MGVISRHGPCFRQVHGIPMHVQKTQYGNVAILMQSTCRYHHTIYHKRVPSYNGSVTKTFSCRAVTGAVEEEQQQSVDLAKVVLKGGKARLFRGDRRSVVVYPGAIDCIIGRPPPSNGDLVVVCDGKRIPLGVGILNLESVFAVRVLAFCRDEADLVKTLDGSLQHEFVEHMLTSRIQSAASLRRMLGFLQQGEPAQTTTACRLINAEGDFLPGLIVDIFGSIAVVSSSALWIENRREGIEKAIREALGSTCTDIVWRPAVDMLRLEGVDIDTDDDEGTSMQESPITVYEYGASFLVSPYGQKTGFYCDQRDNRRQIRDLSKGKSVLDICCYSGGFAIHAALGGASSVTGVDSSGPALELAQKNAAMNDCPDVTFVKEDASKFLDNAISKGLSWDILVLDPPKLAPSRKALTGAARKYVSLNTKAMKVVNPGGILMTCSCSGAMTQSPGEFSKVIQTAAYRAGVKATILSKKGAGADHTIDPHYPEGEYLSNYMVRIS